MKMIQTVLITGGAGYIGNNVTRLLLKKGYAVRVLDRLVFGDAGIKDLYRDDNFTLIQGDICNVREVAHAMENVDIIIDLAAIVGDPACDLNTSETRIVNYESTKVLVEVAKWCNVDRFIFASTCSVYGINQDNAGALTEDSQPNPQIGRASCRERV